MTSEAKFRYLMLKKEFKLASKQGSQLQVSGEAKSWMLAQNDQPEFGARPLRRIISKHLREPLADFLLSQESDRQMKIVVSRGEDGLQFELLPNS